MRRGGNTLGGYFVAFGIGVLVALTFPLRVILIIAAVALVLAGLSLVRC